MARPASLRPPLLTTTFLFRPSQGGLIMLDITTPKGELTLLQERRAAEIYRWHNPGCEYNRTPDYQPAPVDAVLTRDGKCEGVVETKCRNFTLDHFRNGLQGKWLITFDKVVAAKEIAKDLHVPLYGFLYLVDDDCLISRKLWTPEDNWLVELQVMKTKTQATVNGGIARRDNAFIDMKGATVWRML